MILPCQKYEKSRHCSSQNVRCIIFHSADEDFNRTLVICRLCCHCTECGTTNSMEFHRICRNSRKKSKLVKINRWIKWVFVMMDSLNSIEVACFLHYHRPKQCQRRTSTLLSPPCTHEHEKIYRWSQLSETPAQPSIAGITQSININYDPNERETENAFKP